MIFSNRSFLAVLLFTLVALSHDLVAMSGKSTPGGGGQPAAPSSANCTTAIDIPNAPSVSLSDYKDCAAAETDCNCIPSSTTSCSNVQLGCLQIGQACAAGNNSECANISSYCTKGNLVSCYVMGLISSVIKDGGATLGTDPFIVAISGLTASCSASDQDSSACMQLGAVAGSRSDLLTPYITACKAAGSGEAGSQCAVVQAACVAGDSDSCTTLQSLCAGDSSTPSNASACNAIANAAVNGNQASLAWLQTQCPYGTAKDQACATLEAVCKMSSAGTSINTTACGQINNVCSSEKIDCPFACADNQIRFGSTHFCQSVDKYLWEAAAALGGIGIFVAAIYIIKARIKASRAAAEAAKSGDQPGTGTEPGGGDSDNKAYKDLVSQYKSEYRNILYSNDGVMNFETLRDQLEQQLNTAEAAYEEAKNEGSEDLDDLEKAYNDAKARAEAWNDNNENQEYGKDITV